MVGQEKKGTKRTTPLQPYRTSRNKSAPPIAKEKQPAFKNQERRGKALHGEREKKGNGVPSGGKKKHGGAGERIIFTQALEDKKPNYTKTKYTSPSTVKGTGSTEAPLGVKGGKDPRISFNTLKRKLDSSQGMGNRPLGRGRGRGKKGVLLFGEGGLVVFFQPRGGGEGGDLFFPREGKKDSLPSREEGMGGRRANRGLPGEETAGHSVLKVT